MSRPRRLDGPERARLLGIAVEAVAGEVPDTITVSVRGDEAALSDAEGFGFVIGPRQVLQRGAVPFLEVAVEYSIDGLCRLPPLWGRRLPLCPEHPDAHALTIEIGDGVIAGSCPISGIVRVVSY